MIDGEMLLMFRQITGNWRVIEVRKDNAVKAEVCKNDLLSFVSPVGGRPVGDDALKAWSRWSTNPSKEVSCDVFPKESSGHSSRGSSTVNQPTMYYT